MNVKAGTAGYAHWEVSGVGYRTWARYHHHDNLVSRAEDIASVPAVKYGI